MFSGPGDALVSGVFVRGRVLPGVCFTESVRPAVWRVGQGNVASLVWGLGSACFEWTPGVRVSSGCLGFRGIENGAQCFFYIKVTGSFLPPNCIGIGLQTVAFLKHGVTFLFLSNIISFLFYS